MDNTIIKQKVKKLRARGKTYSEIQKILGSNFAKSTISSWCNDVKMPKNYTNNIENIQLEHLRKARILSVAAKKKIQKNRFDKILNDNKHLIPLKHNKDVAKIILATLYLCEGTKIKNNPSITLGNSDPMIINLFLQLLRFCYIIDENKFRCTVQCRHDQNIKKLEDFWLKVTKIPRRQFYQARIDPRSIGKKSLKPDYKGVCRINYFSSDVFWDLIKVAEIICLN